MFCKAFGSCNANLKCPNNCNWKERDKEQETTSEEKMFTDVVYKWMEKQNVKQEVFKAIKCSEKDVEKHEE